VTVLVTGATGFIGSHVVRELRARGLDVRASVRSSSLRSAVADLEGEVEWIPCDLSAATPSELRDLCDSVDACIHAAWYVEPGKYAHAAENVEWVGTSMRLLEALAAQGCLRAVYIGTCFEYDHRTGYLAEDSPTRPWTLYGAAKLSTALMGAKLAEQLGVAFSWARLFYQYGPHEQEGRLVPHVVRSLLSGKDVPVTRGAQIRDFLHVADVASALVEVAGSDHVGAVNIGSGRPVSVREVVSRIAAILDGSGRVRFGARPDSPSDPPFLCANNDVLEKEVGWKPRFDLEAGLRDTVDWWRARTAESAKDSSIKGEG
jgi:nucleoside-diphosphate-sugar epimerase